MSMSGQFDLNLNPFQGSAPSFSSGFGTDLLGSSSGGGLGMDPLTAGFGAASVIGQTFGALGAADKYNKAARYTARMANRRAKEQLRAQERFAGAQLGAQNIFGELDLARQGIAYDFQNQYNAFNPAARALGRMNLQDRMFASGASPGRISLAGKFRFT